MTTTTPTTTPDWQNHIVDSAGYLMSTEDYIKGASSQLLEILELFDGTDGLGNEQTIDQFRAQAACTMRGVSERLVKLAASLDAPRIDESNSDEIGWDAKHSI